MTSGLGVRRLDAPMTRACPFAFSPDGLWVISGGESSVTCTESESGRTLFSIATQGPVCGVAWSAPDAAVVFSRASDGVRVTQLAVPDGGVMASRTRSNLGATALRVDVSADGALALVTPRPWRTDAAHVGELLRLDTLETVAEVAPARVRGLAEGAAVHAMAALSPDGARIAVAYGGGEASPWLQAGRAQLGAVLTWRWSNGETRTMMAGGVGAVLGLEWLGVDTLLAVRNGERRAVDPESEIGMYYANEPRLLVMRSGRTDAVADSDTWVALRIPGVGELDWGLGPAPHAVLHDDRERLLVVGHKRRSGGIAPGGVLRVLSVSEGDTCLVRVVPCEPQMAFGAQWLGRGDELAVLAGDDRSGALVLHRGPLDAREFAPVGVVARSGHDAVGGRLWHNGRWLAASWVEGLGARLSGRLVWFERAEVAASAESL